MKIQALLLLLLFSQSVSAQTFDWWANNVGWDGVMHWSEYLVFSPKFTGPNAMPVPEVSTGKVNGDSYVQLGGQYQSRPGDRTTNLTFRAGHGFLGGLVSLDVFMVPIETYSLSHRRKTERNVYFEHYDKKTAIGDLYVNTNVQILNEDKHPLDLALRIGLKTASSGLDNPARFIDSPGYYFDASSGKSFDQGNWTFRPYVMFGFFAWQTNDESLRQNDAFLYGAGFTASHSNWSIAETIRGYSGYHDIGDRPIILQTSVTRDLASHQLSVNYQYGLRDFLYHSIEVSFRYTIRGSNSSE